MEILGVVFVGLVAAGATLVSLTTDNDELAIIFGLIGSISWLMFAFFALDVTHYDTNGQPLNRAYPGMAVWGAMMSIPNFYVALTGPLAIVADKNPNANEVR